MNNGGQGKGNGPELKLAIIGSIAIGITGFATLFWLAIEDPSRRDSLADAADWLLKVGIGTFYRRDGRETGEVDTPPWT